jgi:hypothetical protein
MANAKEFRKGRRHIVQDIEKFSEKISKKFFWNRENLLFFPMLMLISSGRPPRIALSRPTRSVLAYAGAVGEYSTVSQ